MGLFHLLDGNVWKSNIYIRASSVRLKERIVACYRSCSSTLPQGSQRLAAAAPGEDSETWEHSFNRRPEMGASSPRRAWHRGISATRVDSDN